MQSLDDGKTWARASATIDAKKSVASVSGLEPNKLHAFRLQIDSGDNKGSSNPVYFYSGKMDIKSFGVTGDGQHDDTDKINGAIWQSLAAVRCFSATASIASEPFISKATYTSSSKAAPRSMR
jgi:hypothetical protein